MEYLLTQKEFAALTARGDKRELGDECPALEACPYPHKEYSK